MTAGTELSGRTALVTGASRGIGHAIAEAFASAGAAVVVHFREGEEAARDLVKRLEARGARATALGGDLRLPEQVERLFDSAERELGALDALVNNAGTYPLDSILEMPPASFRSVVESNLDTVHLCTQAAAKRWIARSRAGAIVNVASIEALRPAPLHAHYSAAKSGVLAYTQSAAIELGPRGIRVNAVSPGLVFREGIEDDWPEGVASFRERAPLGRLGRAEEIAQACLFLASDRASFVTGANLVVDGGVLAARAF